MYFIASLFSFGTAATSYQLQDVPVNFEVALAVRQEMDELRNSKDPEPDPSIGYLFVLSASNSFLKKVTHIKSADLEDDFNRTSLAISTARKIVALKANVNDHDLTAEILSEYGPQIVYNGAEWQNDDLKYALDHCIIDYPKEKFIILDIPKDNVNTKGQFLSIKRALNISHVAIGIISHAYHFPRISRMLSEDAPLYPFGPQVTKYAFLVDREFVSPGIDGRVQHEIRNIPIYIDKGDLAKYPATDIRMFKNTST